MKLLVNSINLKREGVRICLGKMCEGEVLKAFLVRYRFDIVSITLVIELKHGTE